MNTTFNLSQKPDPLHSLVIKSFVEIVRMDLESAYRHTVEVDTQGLSVVMIAHKEYAEFVAEQLKARTLTVSIEPEWPDPRPCPLGSVELKSSYVTLVPLLGKEPRPVLR